MKEKLLFIGSLIGIFSPLLIVGITNILVVLGVDTSGYVDIINLVAIGLSAIILVVAWLLLNKYTTAEQRRRVLQNNDVMEALTGNATLIETSLPELASKILTAADERSNALLKSAESKVNTMMNEMLPELAKQTMEIVTKQSQDIIDQTTAKATQVMKSMDELIPTYAKRISDSVAQTVRENNAHYHKMLTEIKLLIPNLPAANSPIPVEVVKYPTIDEITALLQENFAKIEQLVLASIPASTIAYDPDGNETLVTTSIGLTESTQVEEPNLFTTQSEEISEKSDEPATS